MKLSKRARYIIKWNGPRCWEHRRVERRAILASCGKGDEGKRTSATAYACRYRGFFPASLEQFYRMSGVALPSTTKRRTVRRGGGA